MVPYQNIKTMFSVSNQMFSACIVHGGVGTSRITCSSLPISIEQGDYNAVNKTVMFLSKIAKKLVVVVQDLRCCIYTSNILRTG